MRLTKAGLTVAVVVISIATLVLYRQYQSSPVDSSPSASAKLAPQQATKPSRTSQEPAPTVGGSSRKEHAPAATSATATTSSARLLGYRYGTGYASRDPYPEFVALREARARGTFAASFELQRDCLRAMTIVSQPLRHDAQQIATQSANLQMRLQAKQEIEVRCGRFISQDLIQAAVPIAGDSYGDRYRRAIDFFRDHSPESDPAKAAEAMAEIAAQGMWAADNFLRRSLIESLTWRGRSWKENSAEFEVAVRIASRSASPAMQSGSSVADLRDLMDCYRDANACGDYVVRQLTNVAPDRRETVVALARDMAAAFSAGDLRAWRVVQ
jgi:hypothetical protein